MSKNKYALKCLKIHPRWLQLILNGEKEIEIRRRGTEAFNQIIALGNTKTKKVEGYCQIKGAQETSLDWLKTIQYRTMVPDTELDKYANGKTTLWSWLIRSVIPEPHPYLYEPSAGSWGKAYPPEERRGIVADHSITGRLSPKFASIIERENAEFVRRFKERQSVMLKETKEVP
jgi:hypothetical protein